MSDESKPVRLEEIDWRRVLPVINVFSSARMAIHPSVLLPALLLVLALLAGGKAWDFATGFFGSDRSYPGEADAYIERTGDSFTDWRARQADWAADQLYMFAFSLDATRQFTRADARQPDAQARVRKMINDSYASARETEERIVAQEFAGGDAGEAQSTRNLEFSRKRLQDLDLVRRGHLARLAAIQPRGPFAAATKFSIDAIERMASASIQMRWGIDQFRPGGSAAVIDRSTVVGAARDIVLVLPSWLWTAHRWFLIFFGLFALVLWAWIGGAIARLAAWRIARREWLPIKQAFGYARRHAGDAVLGPILPLVLAAVFIGVIWLVGFLAFGLPYVHVVGDVVGGVTYGLVLVLSLAASLCLVGLALGGGLMLPATASDGADAFDAVERGFGYLIGRPWQVVFYNAAALFYGAVTYLFLNVVVFVTLWIAQSVVGSGAGTLAGKVSVALPADRFDSIHHGPVPGRLAGDLDWWMGSAPADWSGKIGTFFVALWAIFFVMLLASFVVGYFVCAQTWIYALVRRSTDGTDLGEIYVERAAPKTPPTAAATPPAPVAPRPAVDMPKPEEIGTQQ